MTIVWMHISMHVCLIITIDCECFALLITIDNINGQCIMYISFVEHGSFYLQCIHGIMDLKWTPDNIICHYHWHWHNKITKITYKRVSETLVYETLTLQEMKSIFISSPVVTHSNLSHIWGWRCSVGDKSYTTALKFLVTVRVVTASIIT